MEQFYINDDEINQKVLSMIEDNSGCAFKGEIRHEDCHDGYITIHIMRNHEVPLISFVLPYDCHMFERLEEQIRISDIWRSDFFEFKKI